MGGFDFQAKDKMKIKSLRSQITMMIIVGLVLFILVGIVFYISKSAVKKTAQQGIKTAQGTALDTQPIKEFVSKCQDKLAKEAITLIGKQGGKIYQSQGGELVEDDDGWEGTYFIKYDNNKVAYNINPPRSYSVAPYFSVPPDYPWPEFPYMHGDYTRQIFDGIFGVNSMPFLNISGGPHSFQSQIESYIDNKMESCADLSSFTSEGYEISVNKSKTTVTIASSDVRIKTSMPIRIINKATSEQTYIDTFSTTVNVRLSDMYYFVKDIINKDVGNIKFNLKDAGNNQNSFRINVLENIFTDSRFLKDDIVVVTDDRSQISGKQFEYRFARKNRAPALYYIKRQSNNQLSEDVEITQAILLDGSDLKAEDPDEDTIPRSSFTISPSLPMTPTYPQSMIFTVTVTDGQLSDYQRIPIEII